MVRVAVFGSSGLLGGELLRALTEAHVEILAPVKNEVDVTHFDSVQRYFTSCEPTHVINATACTNVDELEKDPYLGWQVNALGAGAVARALQHKGKPVSLIHISTNYVFGDSKQQYIEDDTPAPLNTYGKTKAVGESLCSYYGKKPITCHIVRTSWLYSQGRETFADVVAKTLLQGGSVEAAEAYFGNPTYAADLARAITENFILNKQLPGIFHVVNKTPKEGVSRYELACSIAKILSVPSSHIKKVSRARVFARRPRTAVLVNTKLPPLPLWTDSLQTYITEKYGQKNTPSI